MYVHRCAVPPMPFTFKTHLPHLMAHLSYKLVLAWGLLGIRQAGRPKQTRQNVDNRISSGPIKIQTLCMSMWEQ
eukprot:1155077-Pelagomonas_calceolata.AAC.5